MTTTPKTRFRSVAEIEAYLAGISLKHGNHPNPAKGVCVMEAVAYVAGEKHSDHPACASPFITSFLIRLNDNLPDDATRDRWLKALVPKIIGTRGTWAHEQARIYLANDWVVRTALPLWLDQAQLQTRAQELRSFAPLTTPEICTAAATLCRVVRSESWAARDAAVERAREAGRKMAKDRAAWAAEAAGAAGAAERQKLREQIEQAALEKLQPTIDAVRASAVDLVERMIAVHVTPAAPVA